MSNIKLTVNLIITTTASVSTENNADGMDTSHATLSQPLNVTFLFQQDDTAVNSRIVSH